MVSRLWSTLAFVPSISTMLFPSNEPNQGGQSRSCDQSDSNRGERWVVVRRYLRVSRPVSRLVGKARAGMNWSSSHCFPLVRRIRKTPVSPKKRCLLYVGVWSYRRRRRMPVEGERDRPCFKGVSRKQRDQDSLWRRRSKRIVLLYAVRITIGTERSSSCVTRAGALGLNRVNRENEHHDLERM